MDDDAVVYHHATQRQTGARMLFTRQRYNIRVPLPELPTESELKHRRHAVYASEATGLLLIALLLLLLILVRYGHDIHWSLR